MAPQQATIEQNELFFTLPLSCNLFQISQEIFWEGIKIYVPKSDENFWHFFGLERKCINRLPHTNFDFNINSWKIIYNHHVILLSTASSVFYTKIVNNHNVVINLQHRHKNSLNIRANSFFFLYFVAFSLFSCKKSFKSSTPTCSYRAPRNYSRDIFYCINLHHHNCCFDVLFQ